MSRHLRPPLKAVCETALQDAIAAFGRQTSFRVLLAFLTLLTFSHSAAAQSKAVTESAITGGGGQSSGSRFAISGSIGQPAATLTPMTGSRFAVTGGIQARVFIIQPPGAP